MFEEGLEVRPSTQHRWVHGDLHPFHLLRHQGKLAFVLDWGDVFAGDPGVEVASAWQLLDPCLQRPLRSRVTMVEWKVGRAWAAVFAGLFREMSRGSTDDAAWLSARITSALIRQG